MCGIAGILNSPTGQFSAHERLVPMIEALRHRGPDGFGYYDDARCSLAHARLSIIDIETGEQPIHNADRSTWVVFNGEIFNYLELRRELEQLGHRFYTRSDTEVIVHLYDRYGERFVEHLNGQFAIALWDSRQQRLVLARDRVGIRPLYIARLGRQLVFASEVKALTRHPDFAACLDPLALADTLTYWSPLSPDSAFAGVENLAPGHLLIVESDAERLVKYWDWTFPDSQPAAGARSEASWAEELRELLESSVRLQLRADVPVGAYLSGGLDSSAVAALAGAGTQIPLHTFGITFEDAEFDEGEHQIAVAAHLDSHHTSVRCRRPDIAAIFPRVIWHTEVPIVRTAPAPLLLLSQRVHQQGIKVVLTGEGADEIFGGYDLFKEAKIRRFWARAPSSTKRPKLLQRLYPYLRNSPAASRGMTEGFYRRGIENPTAPCFAHLPRWSTTRRAWQFFSRDLQARIGERDAARTALARFAPEMPGFYPMGRDQYVEAHTLLSGYLLSSQGDRMAMANSVEGRYPFLDHRLIEFASRLPPSLKIRGLHEKYLLKRAVQDLLPTKVVRRTKQPYRAPDSESFFVAGKPVDYVEELLSAQRIRDAGYFDSVAVGKLLDKCRAGRVSGFSDNMAFLGILSTMLVDDQFVRGNMFGS